MQYPRVSIIRCIRSHEAALSKGTPDSAARQATQGHSDRFEAVDPGREVPGVVKRPDVREVKRLLVISQFCPWGYDNFRGPAEISLNFLGSM
jgi:hypothetical protein